ncbi:MAG: ATP-grasp domain-containing protein [Alphaproteobacteria bacterium]
MLVLEHDAKEILAAEGVPVPRGALAATPDDLPDFNGPWFVKVQIPAGGRGKAGGIVRAETREEIRDALGRLLGRRLKGHPVRECRIERAVGEAEEAYLSLSVDPASGGINVLLSGTGGMEIESAEGRSALRSDRAARDADAIAATVSRLADGLPAHMASALAEAGGLLAGIFCRLELTQIEINPMLVAAGGAWLAGDAKMIADENAFVRQELIADLVRARASSYPEAALKLAQDFDYVELDPDGEIGLVTTGAGLSMQLIDEMREKGIRPYNFCDIRSGTFRGDPGRLIWTMQQIAKGPQIRGVLVNIFAGVTHLGELADLLLQARAAVPELTARMVVRLVGNGLDEAREILAAADDPPVLEVDLEKAVDLLVGGAE